MEPERWLPVPGYEGLYEVSDLGRVRSLPRRARAATNGATRRVPGTVLQPQYRGHSRSYQFVTLWRDNGRRTEYVHRLVLLAFVGPPPAPDAQASHEPDPDPTNCTLDNLRWRSHMENTIERDLRSRGADWDQIRERLDGREPGSDDGPPCPALDPCVCGLTPF